MVDSQNYLVPQRRNRVYGLATLIDGSSCREEISSSFISCVKSMQSNFQFSMETMFANKPKQVPTSSRQKKLVEMAQEAFPGRTNLFIDCASSISRPTHAEGVAPCLTPEHAIYSTHLERYLQAEDHLNLQGFFKTSLSDYTYNFLIENPALCQDLCGNSFTSTCFQSVFLTSLAIAPNSWKTIGSGALDAPKPGPSVLRRIRGKRPAPDYPGSHPREKKENKTKNARKTVTVKRARTKKAYKRKVKGVDSRKHNKGKKECCSLWDKEQLTQPQFFWS